MSLGHVLRVTLDMIVCARAGLYVCVESVPVLSVDLQPTFDGGMNKVVSVSQGISRVYILVRYSRCNLMVASNVYLRSRVIPHVSTIYISVFGFDTS